MCLPSYPLSSGPSAACHVIVFFISEISTFLFVVVLPVVCQFGGASAPTLGGHDKYLSQGLWPSRGRQTKQQAGSQPLWALTSPTALAWICFSSLEKESPLSHPPEPFSSKPVPTCSRPDVSRLLISSQALIWISVSLQCDGLIPTHPIPLLGRGWDAAWPVQYPRLENPGIPSCPALSLLLPGAMSRPRPTLPAPPLYLWFPACMPPSISVSG